MTQTSELFVAAKRYLHESDVRSIETRKVAVQTGSQIADNTAKYLDESEKVTRQAVSLIDKMTGDSEQKAAATQINVGIEQIASVVQTNSVTAEESAAASEELNAQATMLQSLISQRIKLIK